MLRDVFIPSKIGNSYLFSKKVLTIDVTQFAVQAILVQYRSNKVYVKNKQLIVLKDFSSQSIVSAIKKIISTIGSYDEVVTSLSSASVVFKELELPFVGREKLEMVVGYEVESLLPFSLEQSVIDFIIIDQDAKHKRSKLLVAAALKEDVAAQLTLFEKAEVSLHTVTVDIFALYTLYTHGVYTSGVKHHGKENNKKKNFAPQSKKVEVFVDAGFSVSRVLYLQNGKLKSVRVVPYGVSDMSQAISKKLELSYYDVAQELIAQDNNDVYKSALYDELAKFADHIKQTLSFFEKQAHDDYKFPQKIIFSGLGCSLHSFLETVQSYLEIPVQEISVDQLVKSLKIIVPKKVKIQAQDVTYIALGLFGKYNNDVNFLKNIAHKADNSLLIKQLFVIVALTLSCIGAVYFKSSSELQRWNKAYVASKKELVSTIDTTMGIDVKTERNLKNIVQRCEDAFKASHQRWFAFVRQKELSYLEYLQDLSIRIDRASIGLEITSLLLKPEEVTMKGRLKDFEALQVFEEELAELELLQVVEKPRELSFSIQLKVKDKGQHGHN